MTTVTLTGIRCACKSTKCSLPNEYVSVITNLVVQDSCILEKEGDFGKAITESVKIKVK